MDTEPMDTTMVPTDPLRRFVALVEALGADHSWWEDHRSLRFAAVTALTCPGEPAEVAAAIRHAAQQIRAESRWAGDLHGPLAFLLAAMMVNRGDSPLSFREELDRTHKLFRDARLRRGGIHETMAIWVLRLQAGQRPIPAAAVRRFAAIYEEMKRHHWWLTGPDDFPACAVLCGQSAAPREIGERVERLYQALHRLGASRGDPLQTAANLLYLADGEPDLVAGRFAALIDAFRQRKVTIVPGDYDELTMLVFLDAQPGAVADAVLRSREPIRALRPKPGPTLSFHLACGVGFLELLRSDAAPERAGGVQALVDLQALLVAQQAAAVAAATAAATTAAVP